MVFKAMSRGVFSDHHFLNLQLRDDENLSVFDRQCVETILEFMAEMEAYNTEHGGPPFTAASESEVKVGNENASCHTLQAGKPPS
jgi:hypothetical protein